MQKEARTRGHEGLVTSRQYAGLDCTYTTLDQTFLASHVDILTAATCGVHLRPGIKGLLYIGHGSRPR